MRAVWQPESVTRRMSEIASTALLWGYDAMELRSVGGPEDRIPHISERLVRSACLEADLPVAAVDPEYFAGSAADRAAWMNELATLPEVVQLARRIGSSGFIVGSLDDTGDADEARRRILGEAGKLADRAGLLAHVRAGEPENLAHTDDVIRSLGNPSVRPMPEFEVSVAMAEPDIPEFVGRASYVRLIVRGPLVVSIDDTETLRESFTDIAKRLKAGGFDGDVCLEFADRPEPASGLRISTAFVSAVARTG